MAELYHFLNEFALSSTQSQFLNAFTSFAEEELSQDLPSQIK